MDNLKTDIKTYFPYKLVEEDGVYLLQAGVFDAELPDIILQVQEVGGLYVRAFPHRPEIVAQ
jgi:hypothetical protein